MKLPRLFLALIGLASLAVERESYSQSTASSPVVESAPMTFRKDTSIEDTKDTGNKAIAALLHNFAESKHAPGAKGFILLPLPKDIDSGYFSQQFETALTQRFAEKEPPLKVYTRNDKTLAQIFDFTAWAQTFPDAINEATLQKLGGIVDAPAIIQPRLDLTVDDRGTITARANMRVIVRATAEIPPGVSEGYAQMKAMPTNAEIIRWAGYGLVGLIALIIVVKFIRAVGNARRPR